MANPFNSTMASGLWIVPGLLAIQSAPALAQTPFKGQAQIPPALTLALALTCLVLFLLYLVQKTMAKSGRGNPPRRPVPGSRANLSETHKALNSLFSHSAIAMAKTTPDRARIINATPALCRILGYTKPELLKVSPADLGILPADRAARQHLDKQGWTRHVATLFDRTTGKPRKYRMLDIATRSGGRPVVLTIVSETQDNAAAPWKPVGSRGNAMKNDTFN